jgi:hypothetical protein
LISRELVERIARRLGEKGERFRQLLGNGEAEPNSAASPSLEERVTRLEEEVGRLRDTLDGPDARSVPFS